MQRLYGVCESRKLEHVIQKATELGAGEIVAFPSSRCVAKPDDKALSKKLERWQKIAASAAEQSGRRFWRRPGAIWRFFRMKMKRRFRFVIT